MYIFILDINLRACCIVLTDTKVIVSVIFRMDVLSLTVIRQ